MKHWLNSDGEYDWDEEWDGTTETTDDQWLLKEGWKHFPRTPEELKRENQPYCFEQYHRNMARKYQVNIEDWYQKVLRIKRVKKRGE